MKQEQWAEIWQDCMKLDYTPQVDVRAIKPNKRASEERRSGCGANGCDQRDDEVSDQARQLEAGCGGSMSEKRKTN